MRCCRHPCSLYAHTDFLSIIQCILTFLFLTYCTQIEKMSIDDVHRNRNRGFVVETKLNFILKFMKTEDWLELAHKWIVAAPYAVYICCTIYQCLKSFINRHLFHYYKYVIRFCFRRDIWSWCTILWFTSAIFKTKKLNFKGLLPHQLSMWICYEHISIKNGIK